MWAKFKSPLFISYSRFWFDFFIFERLIMIALNNWILLKIISMDLIFYFLVCKEYRKNCHCDIHIRSSSCANTLNYLSKNTSSKLKNNFMLLDPQFKMQIFWQKCLLLQCSFISLHLTHLLTGKRTSKCKNQTSSCALPLFIVKLEQKVQTREVRAFFQSLKLGLAILVGHLCRH